MTHFLAFLQRLTSPIGQSTVKAAWLEFIVLAGCITAIVSDLKVKNFSDLLNQGNMVYTAALILVADVRSIVSSNETAIANPAVPKVTGVVNSTPQP